MPGVLLASFSPFLAAAQEAVSPEDRLPPLRPARGLLPPSFWEQYGTWIVLGAALFFLLLALLVWLLLRPRPPVPVPPEVQARRTLDSLRQEPETGVVLSRVSQVLKTYFSAVFGLPEGELTTGEFSHALRATAEPGISLKDHLCEFLRQCDERKFAPKALPAENRAPEAGPVPPVGAVLQASRFIDAAETRRAELRARAAAARGAANNSSAAVQEIKRP